MEGQGEGGERKGQWRKRRGEKGRRSYSAPAPGGTLSIHFLCLGRTFQEKGEGPGPDTCALTFVSTFKRKLTNPGAGRLIPLRPYPAPSAQIKLPLWPLSNAPGTGATSQLSRGAALPTEPRPSSVLALHPESVCALRPAWRVPPCSHR